MRLAFLKRKATLPLVLGAAAVLVGVGIAAWSTSGSGNGYSKAATASSLTLADATAYTTADLYPGATAALYLRVTNPNPFPVKLTSVTRTGAVTSDKGAACNASTGVTFSDPSSLSLTVAANATATVTVTSSVSMSNASDDSCQGAVFTIPVSVTGVST